MKGLHAQAIQYVKKHYPDGLVEEIAVLKDKYGRAYYKVVVVEDEVVYGLEFNHLGGLMRSSQKPLYDEDYYEGGFYGAPEE